MEYPKISIVTPNYNKGEYIEQTILSVLSQGYPNLEYIIIDGGSTDQSIDIIKKYSDRLTYWVSEPDHGMYEAIKKGFEHCTGEIMAWIGSDDIYMPRSLFTVAEIFTSYPQVNWLVGASTHLDKHGRIVSSVPSKYFSRLDLLSYRYKWIQQESTFWRSSLYDRAAGLNPSLKLAGDFDLWVKFSGNTDMYVTTALIGAFRALGSGQLSNDMNAYNAEVKAIIDDALRRDPKSAAKVRKIYWLRRLSALLTFILCRNIDLSAQSKSTIAAHTIKFDRPSQRFTLSEQQ